MPPQNQQPVSNQNISLNKKIHNAGQSVFLMGILMTVLGLISVLGVSSLPQSEQLANYAWLVALIVGNIFLIILGMKIKNSTNNASIALSAIRTALIINIAILGVLLLKFILKPTEGGGGLAGILTLVLALYLLVAQSGIKKLSR